MDSKGYIPIHKTVMKLLDSQHTLGRNDQYTMHYTSQRPPFIPRNRTIRAVTCDVVRDWYGNVLVIKADGNNHVHDITEREVGLIEYLVSWYSLFPSLMLNLIHFTGICPSAMSESSDALRNYIMLSYQSLSELPPLSSYAMEYIRPLTNGSFVANSLIQHGRLPP